MSSQLIGAVLVTVGVALLWSMWALVVGGVLLVLAPELLALRSRR